MTRCLALLLGSALVVSGCGGSNRPNSGGQTGGEGVGCLPVASTPLGLDDASPLGFTGADVVALVGGEHAGQLAWAKGGMTGVTVTFEYAGGQVHFVDREWKDDGSGTAAEISTDCNDVIEVPGILSFATADGAFAESWPANVIAETKATATSGAKLDLEHLQGTYTVTEVDPASFDQVSASLAVSFEATGVHGSVDGMGSKCDGGGSEGTCSGTAFEVATF